MSERRDGGRYSLWFPVRLEDPSGLDGVAVSRNISETGVLMVAATRLEVGATLKVTFHVAKGAPEEIVEAKIVRCEQNPSDPTGLWPYRVAVEFVEPHPELEALLRGAGAAQT